MKNIGSWIEDLLASRGFFWAVIGFFLFEALWFVFSIAYPMAFDEEFHFGVIKIYAEGVSPFLTEQPDDADTFGALARDPSYLFHFLMSFPCRLFALFTDNQDVQVILLRLLNVAMFAGGLLLFRRVLLKAKLSEALANTAIAVFVLIPVVPHLAATINYDNLFFLLFAWLLLLAHRLVISFNQRKVDLRSLMIFLIGCMATGLVKYASLPLIVVLVTFLTFVASRSFWKKPALLASLARNDFKQLPAFAKTGLLVSFVILFGMFFERYGVNIISYGQPVPACDKIISLEQCMEYGPFARNYLLAETKPNFDTNPITYMNLWIDGMHQRSFFAVSGPTYEYATREGLPIPSAAAIVLAIIGLAAAAIYFRRILRNNIFLQLLLVTSVVYCVVLWLNGYADYLKTGQPVAVNGRYLLPILLPLAAVMGHGLHMLLRRATVVKPYAAALVILLFLCGGGVFTFMILAEPSWYW